MKVIKMKILNKFVLTLIVLIVLILAGIVFKNTRRQVDVNTTIIELDSISGYKEKITFSVGESKDLVVSKLNNSNVKYEIIDKKVEPYNYTNKNEVAMRSGYYVFIFTPGKLSFIILDDGNGMATKLPVNYDESH